MASAAHDRRGGGPFAHISSFLHTASTKLHSFLDPKSPSPPKIHSPLSLATPFNGAQPDSLSSSLSRTPPSSSSSDIETMNSSKPVSELPSEVRVSTNDGGGPAFLGQVFSVYERSETVLTDLSTQVDIPFLSERTPEWLKEMFAAVNKSKRKPPVFRFFMEMNDIVPHVELLNIPNAVVGACSLEIAYEHFKEKPGLFQFVPNKRQVREANKLLKIVPHSDGRKKIDGVPVFSAQNLDTAIETTDGLKRYTPYFFDKTILDGILEESVDQHFQSLIEIRDLYRRSAVYGSVDDDNLEEEDADMIGESMWELPEVQEVQNELIDEMGHPDIPLSLISKAAVTQILYAVDKVVLGNRWLRKAIGVQPKFRYMVDSFEKMSAASFHRANTLPNSGCVEGAQLQRLDASNVEREDNAHSKQAQMPHFQFAFGDWLIHPWLKQQQKSLPDSRNANCSGQHRRELAEPSPFHPKITIVIPKEMPGMSEASIQKKIDDMMEELELVEQENESSSTRNQSMVDERDPLFVAGVEGLSFGCVIEGTIPLAAD